MNVESMPLRRIGFVVLKGGVPARTGRQFVPYLVKTGWRAAAYSKSSKIYHHAGFARRVARLKSDDTKGKTSVFAAFIAPGLAGDLRDETEIAGSYPVGFAVIDGAGVAVKTGGHRDPTAKLYQSLKVASRIAHENNAAAFRVFI
jgi:hypothetical protein